MITPDQQQRRARSESYCQQHKIPTYKGALYTPPEAEITLRSLDEIVDRALALCYVGLKSEGLEAEILAKFDAKYSVIPHLSPEETAYSQNAQPTEQQTIEANWRYESLHILLWALGFVDTLAYPKDVCDVAKDVNTLLTRTNAQLRLDAQLRPAQEILEQTDIALRLHWACRDAHSKDIEEPADLDTSVVFERHYALNWLISNNPDEDWDAVTTNT